MPARAHHHRPVELESTAVGELQSRVLSWYAANRRDLPWRRTVDPYAILVSEVMLQQTQVSRVVEKHRAFLTVFPTLEALAQAPLGDVLRQWSGLGYNTRARRLHDCAHAMTAAAHGDKAPTACQAALPRTLDGLLQIPGIGPYTARAVLIFAHNDDLAAVDANVRRVLTHELGLPRDLGADSLQRIAEAVLPTGCSRDWHNALMDYGALVLTTRATGIPARTRQSAFEGSHRQLRARAVRLLLAGPQRLDNLAEELGLAPAAAAELVEELIRDGLLHSADGVVAIA